MPVFAISALVGIITGLWVPVFSSGLYWPLTMLIGGSLAWWLAGQPLLVVLVALGAASLQGHWFLENRLPASLVGQDIVVEGVVEPVARHSHQTRVRCVIATARVSTRIAATIRRAVQLPTG